MVIALSTFQSKSQQRGMRFRIYLMALGLLSLVLAVLLWCAQDEGQPAPLPALSVAGRSAEGDPAIDHNFPREAVGIERGELPLAASQPTVDLMVRGRVAFEDGAPVAVATVIAIAGARDIVSQSDAEGRFSISVPSVGAKVRAIYQGCASEDVSVHEGVGNLLLTIKGEFADVSVRLPAPVPYRITAFNASLPGPGPFRNFTARQASSATSSEGHAVMRVLKGTYRFEFILRRVSRVFSLDNVRVDGPTLLVVPDAAMALPKSVTLNVLDEVGAKHLEGVVLLDAQKNIVSSQQASPLSIPEDLLVRAAFVHADGFLHAPFPSFAARTENTISLASATACEVSVVAAEGVAELLEVACLEHQPAGGSTWAALALEGGQAALRLFPGLHVFRLRRLGTEDDCYWRDAVEFIARQPAAVLVCAAPNTEVLDNHEAVVVVRGLPSWVPRLAQLQGRRPYSDRASVDGGVLSMAIDRETEFAVVDGASYICVRGIAQNVSVDLGPAASSSGAGVPPEVCVGALLFRDDKAILMIAKGRLAAWLASHPQVTDKIMIYKNNGGVPRAAAAAPYTVCFEDGALHTGRVEYMATLAGRRFFVSTFESANCISVIGGDAGALRGGFAVRMGNARLEALCGFDRRLTLR